MNNIFPLSKASVNKPLRVIEINGTRAIKQRLLEMGFIEGSRLTIIEMEKDGPCIVLLENTRLVLGKAMAERIMVSLDVKRLFIALAGNPNTGKSTIFNNLTGENQHIGNYPGVTVEKKEGFLRYKDYEINIVDLPGIYSLTTHSIDELIARNFIIEEKPDVIIDVVNAGNIERSLYLSLLLMELEIPLVICFNMYDIAKKEGFVIDKKRLSELLNLPVIFTIASKNEGMDELIDEAIRLKEEGFKKTRISYEKEIDEEIEKIETLLKDEELLNRYPKRWLAIKLFEDDPIVTEELKKSLNCGKIMGIVKKASDHLTSIFGEEPWTIIAEKRYGFISGVCSEAVKRSYEERHSISDKIDKLFLNRILGIPMFLLIIFFLFKAIFGISELFIRSIQNSILLLSALVISFPFKSIIGGLIADGIIGGLGNVLAFTPPIFLLYFMLAFLEDSGYISRVAFIMDSLMHKIGLHGRSFIPMILGFGCNVPAILATRTIEDKNNRITTILIMPFTSCGARLPVYTMLIAAFFPSYKPYILFSLYITGIILAIITAAVFKTFIFKGESQGFVMELPPYRIPTLKALFIHSWERGKAYLKRAGLIIFIASILIYLLSNFPKEQSYLTRTGHAISPLFSSLGISSWKISVSLITGVVAKETIISTLGTLYSRDKMALKTGIKNELNPLSSFCLLIFILLYIPCLPTLIAIKQETNSLRWTIFAIFYHLIIAFSISSLVYQTISFSFPLGLKVWRWE